MTGELNNVLMDKVGFVDVMELWLRETFPSLDLRVYKDHPSQVDHIRILNEEQQGSNYYTGLIGCVFTEDNWGSNCSVGLWCDDKGGFKYFKPTDPEFFNKLSTHLKFILRQCKRYTHS